jgi:hypothetical protein
VLDVAEFYLSGDVLYIPARFSPNQTPPFDPVEFADHIIKLVPHMRKHKPHPTAQNPLNCRPVMDDHKDSARPCDLPPLEDESVVMEEVD